MREVEVKILGVNKAQLVSKLKSLGAKPVFAGKLETHYFDFSNRLLQKNRTVLRLRKKGSKAILGVKQPESFVGAKTMHEHETTVDFSKTKTILFKLGLLCFAKLSKHRESWRLGKIHFDFDQYCGPFKKVPVFLEIEAPNKKQLFAMAQKLGFARRDLKPWRTGQLLQHYGLKQQPI